MKDFDQVKYPRQSVSREMPDFVIETADYDRLTYSEFTQRLESLYSGIPREYRDSAVVTFSRNCEYRHGDEEYLNTTCSLMYYIPETDVQWENRALSHMTYEVNKISQELELKNKIETMERAQLASLLKKYGNPT